MKRLKLVVEKRKITGKKVKKLRKEGIMPANIYGKDIKSITVQLKAKEFENAYKEAKETSLVDVELDGKIMPSLIHNAQRAPLSKDYLHADFYKVDLTQKVKAMIPLVAIGEAKAVLDKIGLLLQPLSQIEVEALPEDLPERIEVSIKPLATVGQQITVGEIKAPKGVTILADKAQVVVQIGQLISKEAQEQAAAEQAAAEAAKAATATPAEGAEGAPTTEAKAEEGAKPEATKVASDAIKAATATPTQAKPEAQSDKK